MHVPFITVAIPTYRRLPTLRRAVESVFAQAFHEWEMVISDDETPSGATWEFLKDLARSDLRVRPVKNSGPHGAAFNHNSALKVARGEWIKILEDDDVLRPHCLQVLCQIVKEHRDVIAVSCACEHFVNGQLVSPFFRRDRALLERIEPGDALLAMYVLDEACWARPSQQMLHRSVVDDGVLFEKLSCISTLYDSWFNARVHRKGAVLVYNSPLVEWHQGQHETLTSTTTEDQLAAQFLAFRKLVLPLVPKDLEPPALKSVEGMMMVIRALSHLRGLRFREAIRTAPWIWDAEAYRLAIRWLLRHYYPRRFSSIPRKVICKDQRDLMGTENFTD
jgi:glycosyltransferase involved in cell wall biosynthesis